jgi:uncharacterized PurR-regulated membrane protein YhhQ (DUF165 family)
MFLKHSPEIENNWLGREHHCINTFASIFSAHEVYGDHHSRRLLIIVLLITLTIALLLGIIVFCYYHQGKDMFNFHLRVIKLNNDE